MNCVGCDIKINPLNAAAPFCDPVCRKKHRAKRKKEEELNKAKNEKRRSIYPLKNFYRTHQWRTIRYEALRLANGRCALCGLGAADGIVLHCDHIVPKSMDPKRALDVSNIQVLCNICNQGKRNYDDTDWR
jgi:5-methylcytosine-specific restriction endonuclease McrA